MIKNNIQSLPFQVLKLKRLLIIFNKSDLNYLIFSDVITGKKIKLKSSSIV